MANIALSVDVKTKPGLRDAFVERIKRHGAYCLANETGCLRFDVLVPLDETDRVILFEVYADSDSLTAHDGSGHMAEYRADVAHMIESRVRVTCAVA